MVFTVSHPEVNMTGRDIFEELMEGMQSLVEHRNSLKESNEGDSCSEPVNGEDAEIPKPTDLCS
jgi:hypothetical protein